MRKIQSSIPFLKSKLPIFISILLFIILSGGLLFADHQLRIKHVVLLSKENKEHPIRGFSAFENKNIYFFNIEEAENTIKENNSYIKDVSIAKQYPNTVTVKVSYYVPRAYLQMKEGFLLLGEEGRILEKLREEPSSKLPIINYYQNLSFSNYQAGKDIGLKDIQDSIFFLEKLSSMKMQVIRIDIDSFHMLGLYTNGEVFLFTSEKSRTEQEYQLDAAIREFRVSGTKFKSLDLRFDKPVVILTE